MKNINILFVVLCTFVLIWLYNSYNSEFMGNMIFETPPSPPPPSPPPAGIIGSGPAPGGSGSSQQTIQLQLI